MPRWENSDESENGVRESDNAGEAFRRRQIAFRLAMADSLRPADPGAK